MACEHGVGTGFSLGLKRTLVPPKRIARSRTPSAWGFAHLTCTCACVCASDRAFVGLDIYPRARWRVHFTLLYVFVFYGIAVLYWNCIQFAELRRQYLERGLSFPCLCSPVPYPGLRRRPAVLSVSASVGVRLPSGLFLNPPFETSEPVLGWGCTAQVVLREQLGAA